MDSTVPTRGERNHNPGNILYRAVTRWRGQTGTDGRFAIFDTPEHGIRAISVTLRTYKRAHKIHTVEGAISRWSATDREAYIANVAESMGVGPLDVIDLNDPITRGAMVRGIIHQENGRVIYPDPMIAFAVRT